MFGARRDRAPLWIGRLLAFVFAMSGPLAATAGDLPYRQAPAPIGQILDAPGPADVLPSPDGARLAVAERDGLPTIAALSEPILRLAGYRINPRNHGPAEVRIAWSRRLWLLDIAHNTRVDAKLPAGLRFSETAWAPDGRKLALLADAPDGLELWVVDLTGAARRVSGAIVNAAFASPVSRSFVWLPDSSGLLFRETIAHGPPPAEAATPVGPLVQENIGATRGGRTYQDLLANPHDEALFTYYFTSQLARLDLTTGAIAASGRPGIISTFALSPDGRYVCLEILKPPFSYSVPAARFPTSIEIWSAAGDLAHRLADRPAADNLSPLTDAAPAGPREPQWRADKPATLAWVEAQDGGDPKRPSEVRDRVLMLDAPFTQPPATLADLKGRLQSIDWGKSDAALVLSRWWQTRDQTQWLVDPSGAARPRMLLQRNYQDRYTEALEPVRTPGPFGAPVMRFTAAGDALVTGHGASRAGEHPFLAHLNIATGATKVVWRSADLDYETVEGLLGPGDHMALTRRETVQAPSNYFVRDLRSGHSTQLTRFPDPAPAFGQIRKQTINYVRADGVALSGALYLPAGYEPVRDGRLPLLMWAYPMDFNDAAIASQSVDESRNRFIRPEPNSPLLLVTQGYAVLDGPSMPIVGGKGAVANDTYVEQLTADAKAAIDKVVALGVGDPARIAIGGHSYGAFMVANLLAHTDLFHAGIAQSGAYNRTLTPFGFQTEQRTYWQAVETYTQISPFTFADRIKTPLLLIHGADDDNSGTFPLQSERLFAAMKGLGGTVRFVLLPDEPHTYRARESVGHVQWEMATWLDRYLKGAP